MTLGTAKLRPDLHTLSWHVKLVLNKNTCSVNMRQDNYRFISKCVFGNHFFLSNCSTQAPRYCQPYCKECVSRSPLAGWPSSRCLCVLSDSDKAASFSACSSTYRLLPATLSNRLEAVLCLPGTGSGALCGMIHEVLHLFGAKSVNCAQKRTDCVCRASLMWKRKKRGRDGQGWPPMSRGKRRKRFLV